MRRTDEEPSQQLTTLERKSDGESVLCVLLVRGSGKRRRSGEMGAVERLVQPGLQLFSPFAGECLAGILSTRNEGMEKSKKEARILSERICRSKAIEKHDAESSTQISKLEFDLMHQWSFLFQHMSDIWKEESGCLGSSLQMLVFRGSPKSSRKSTRLIDDMRH